VVACLPSFYVLGLPKCGTTVLYEALMRHPHVAAPPEKESHFWTGALAPPHVADAAAGDAHVRRHTRALGDAFMKCVRACVQRPVCCVSCSAR
jgi:hypothetical protein